MQVEVRVPEFSESVTEGTLSAWHKQVGERVSRDENLADLETDKVVLEIPAPEDGVLTEIRVEPGTTVQDQEVLAIIDTEAAPTAGDAQGGAATEQAESPAPEQAEPDQAPQSEQRGAETATRSGPAARKLLAEHGLDPADVTGTGRDGRITKGDVLQHLDQRQPAADRPAAPQPESVPEASADGRPVRRVPMTRIRQRIAERLSEVTSTAAILTTFNEVDMAPVMRLRKEYQELFQKQHDTRLGYMSFFTKACVQALQRFPTINASIEGQNVLYHDYYDIGIAISTPRGLVVPVLRDADRMSFAGVERTIADMGQRAQTGKLGMEELVGGTFTITNGGIFGSMLSTPIINPPQSAILGMHRIEERPVARDGEVVIRPMMYLALSYDHRLIDGHEAVLFLTTVKALLEDPARLILEV